VVEQALLALFEPIARRHEHVALVAVGGFGRGELFPKSDVDLMVLVPEGADDTLRQDLERYFAALWDIGLAPGHSVRTPADCQAAAVDLTVATALMEARCLAGDARLLAEANARLAADPPWPPQRYRAAKLEEQRGRHQRFHGTAHNLEPNLKDGPGGCATTSSCSGSGAARSGPDRWRNWCGTSC
jgi:[protein-PII] uridylyltransferase